MYDTDFQLKTLSRRIEVFNMKIIMRREYGIFFSKYHIRQRVSDVFLIKGFNQK